MGSWGRSEECNCASLVRKPEMDFLTILHIFSSFNLREFAAEGRNNLSYTGGKPAIMKPHQTTISFSPLPSLPTLQSCTSPLGRAGFRWLADVFSASSHSFPPRPSLLRLDSSCDLHAKKNHSHFCIIFSILRLQLRVKVKIFVSWMSGFIHICSPTMIAVVPLKCVSLSRVTLDSYRSVGAAVNEHQRQRMFVKINR